MPLYDIEHVTPLTASQQGSLAKALTACHATRFHTPSFFINVRFTDASAMPVYRGGVLRRYNRAILRTRVSEKRSVEMMNAHCLDVIRIWGEIIGTEGEKELRTVWVLGALTTAVEAGFARPQVCLAFVLLPNNLSVMFANLVWHRQAMSSAGCADTMPSSRSSLTKAMMISLVSCTSCRRERTLLAFDQIYNWLWVTPKNSEMAREQRRGRKS
jgi:Putative oxalocrotonate tautomerase enzyme